MSVRLDFHLREIFRCRKFSLSFFSIVSDHAELNYSELRTQKKAYEIFRQRTISLGKWKSALTSFLFWFYFKL